MDILKSLFQRSWSTKNQIRPDFGSITELSQVSSIFDWVFNPSYVISSDCAKTIDRLIKSHTANRNKSLYHSLRYISIKTRDLEVFERFEGDVKISLYCVASMNSNGYVREKALKFLIKFPSQRTFPFILFRLADWVPEIRRATEKGIRFLIQRQKAEFFITHHKILDWLLKVERTELQGIHYEITSFIFSEENIHRIIQNIDAYPEGGRHFIFRHLVNRNKLDQEVIEKILEDKSYLIRLIAVRNINLSEQPEMQRRLLNDRSQSIRYYVVNTIPKSRSEDFQLELSKLIFDKSKSIRVASRLLLSELGTQNYPERYQAEITRHPSQGSIVGLSEVGDKGDMYQLSTYLNSDSPRVRAAALYAISNLDYEYAKELAFDLLKDPSITVKRTCLGIIPKDRFFEDLQKLRSIYDDGTSETRRFVLKIISNYSGWSIAGDFLKGINEVDDQVNQTAYAFLSAWYNYSIRLGTDQKESDKEYVMAIYGSLNHLKHEVPQDIKRIIDEIPFIFGTK